VPPPGQRIIAKDTNQFSAGPNSIKRQLPPNMHHARKSTGSAHSHGEQPTDTFAPIACEKDLYTALREHRRRDKRASDYPHSDVQAQILLVGKIIAAFRNTEGCLDNAKVLSTYNGSYSDRQIEIAAWQIMVCDLNHMY
jgi:hypothetical protein